MKCDDCKNIFTDWGWKNIEVNVNNYLIYGFRNTCLTGEPLICKQPALDYWPTTGQRKKPLFRRLLAKIFK